MTTAQSGRIWYSTAPTPPALVDGEFADGWTLLGVPNDPDRSATAKEWRRALDGKRGTALSFWVLAEPEVDPAALPASAWLGVDPHGHGGVMRLLSAARATLNAPVSLRRPEQHPGRLGPHKPVGVKVPTKGGVSFRRAEGLRTSR